MPTAGWGSLGQFRLDGRVALVTGGSRGLGKAIARALAGAGADVAVASRHLDEAETAAVEIARACGTRVLALRADVREPAEVEGLVAATVERLGPVDVLVNNAGVNIRGPIDELTLEDWRDTVETNLTGPWVACRAVVPGMRARRRGRIVNIGSTLSAVGMPGRSAYAATKGGLAQLTRVLALELAPFGVTCNAICPGPFLTELNARFLADPEVAATFTARVPLGRWGDPTEIGGAAVFLASDASSYVTGTTLFVDGGWTAQ